MFDGNEPLDVLLQRTRFSTAADELDVTMGEAPYLLAHVLGGVAKKYFAPEKNGPHGSAFSTSFPHTVSYLLTCYYPSEALHSARMALLSAGTLRDEGECSLYHRLMRFGRTLIVTYDAARPRYLYLQDLHPSIHGQEELADRTCSTLSGLLSLAQKICDGIRSANVASGKDERHAKANSALQLDTDGGVKAEPDMWATSQSASSKDTPPHNRGASRRPGEPPTSRTVTPFSPTGHAAQTDSPAHSAWSRRPGSPARNLALIPLRQVQFHCDRSLGHYSRACPSPDPAPNNPRAQATTAPKDNAAGRPALQPSRVQFSMASIEEDRRGDPLVPPDDGSLKCDQAAATKVEDVPLK